MVEGAMQVIEGSTFSDCLGDSPPANLAIEYLTVEFN
jgi:hypothetical protein